MSHPLEVGSDAPGQWKVGDRVADLVHGGLYSDRGAFAEYLKVEGDLAWKIPAEMSDEDATTYGVSATTAMMALNLHLGVPWLDQGPQAGSSEQPVLEKGSPVFVYSGATSAGLYTIQLARAAGCTVVTAASPRSFDLVKRYGADSVLDYRSPTAVEDITREFPDITVAMDCFSEGESTNFCVQVLKNKSGKVVTLIYWGKSTTPGVECQFILGYTLLGRAFQWFPPNGPKFEARPSDRKALARFYASLPRLTKDLKPIPIKVLDGGFDGILAGLAKLRAGEAAGGKFVVKL